MALCTALNTVLSRCDFSGHVKGILSEKQMVLMNKVDFISVKS